MTYLTPARAWARIAYFAATYGGEFDRGFYETLTSIKPDRVTRAVTAVACLQKLGVVFTAPVAQHWALELCGAFEITHRHYKQPEHNDTAHADTLYNVFMEVFGYEIDEQQTGGTPQ